MALKAMAFYVSLGKTLYSIRSTFQREGMGVRAQEVGRVGGVGVHGCKITNYGSHQDSQQLWHAHMTGVQKAVCINCLKVQEQGFH